MAGEAVLFQVSEASPSKPLRGNWAKAASVVKRKSNVRSVNRFDILGKDLGEKKL